MGGGVERVRISLTREDYSRGVNRAKTILVANPMTSA